MSYEKSEKWEYGPESKQEKGTTATVEITGTDGTIDIKTTAIGTANSSSASGARDATLNGEITWKATGVNPMPKTRTRIRVEAEWDYSIELSSAEETKAHGEANGSMTLTVDGNQVDDSTLFQRKKSVPLPSTSNTTDKQTQEIFSETVVHSSPLKYAVKVSVSANASHEGHSSAEAKARIAKIKITANPKEV